MDNRGAYVKALIKRPDREMVNRPAPVDPKYENFPSSTNIEDRRGEFPWEALLAPTGYNAAEWATLLRHPFTSTEQTLPHRFLTQQAAPLTIDDPLAVAVGYNDIGKKR